ncbi:Zinc metalloproteinase nas-14 [Trichinella nelsoni]|uniref:Zinc metalloproteinase nas-14 n=1 Tax=Trichinella nelsoni TaxID=6336 RepID=A0A0V0RKN5_9BILA|nr:Zinc metalloproteinase nas-14 [Trichinella nelsoni]
MLLKSATSLQNHSQLIGRQPERGNLKIRKQNQKNTRNQKKLLNDTFGVQKLMMFPSLLPVLSVLLLFSNVNSQTESISKKALDAFSRIPSCAKPSIGGRWVDTGAIGLCGTRFCRLPEEFCASRDSESDNPEFLECVTRKSNEDYLCILQQYTPFEISQHCQSVLMVAASSKSLPAKTNNVAQSPQHSQCEDKHQFCCFWAYYGECDKNAKFMKSLCQKSCGTCECNESDKSLCPVELNVENCKWTPAATRKREIAEGSSNIQSQPNLGRSAYGSMGGNGGASPLMNSPGTYCIPTATNPCGYWPIPESPTLQSGGSLMPSSPYEGMPTQPVRPMVLPAPVPRPSYGSPPQPVGPTPYPSSRQEGYAQPQPVLITPGPPSTYMEPVKQPTAHAVSPYGTAGVQQAPSPPYGQPVQPAPPVSPSYAAGQMKISVPAPPTYVFMLNTVFAGYPIIEREVVFPEEVLSVNPINRCAGGAPCKVPGFLKPETKPMTLECPPSMQGKGNCGTSYNGGLAVQPQSAAALTPINNCAPGSAPVQQEGGLVNCVPSAIAESQPAQPSYGGGIVNCVPGSFGCSVQAGPTGGPSYGGVPPRPGYPPVPNQGYPVQAARPVPSPYGQQQKVMKLIYHRGKLMYQRQ